MTNRVRKTRGKVPPSAQMADPPASNSPTNSPNNSLISDTKLKQLYSTMLQCRILDQRVHELGHSSGKPAHHFGREATVVGAALDLRRDDWLVASQADVLSKFLKRMPLASIFSELDSGKAGKDSGAKAPSVSALREDQCPFHLVPGAQDPAAQLNRAAGVALAVQAKRSGNIVLAFCGEASASGRRWHESLTFAARHCLPLLIVEQIKASTGTASVQRRKPIASLVTEEHFCGLPIIPVDAQDVVAIYRVAYESIHKARHGGGPTLIRAVSFPAPKIGKAHHPKHADAVARMEDYLTAKGLFTPQWKQKVIEAFNREVASALEAMKKPASRR